jgi:hypothetical protein
MTLVISQRQHRGVWSPAASLWSVFSFLHGSAAGFRLVRSTAQGCRQVWIKSLALQVRFESHSGLQLQRGMSRSALGCEALMSHRPFLVVRRAGDFPPQMIIATLIN